MWHFNCNLPEHLKASMEAVKDRAGYTYTDLCRMGLELLFRPEHFNREVPTLSGQVVVSQR